MTSTNSVLRSIRQEMKKTIVGQEKVIDLMLITILSNGHAIIEGVPGLAKTLIVNSLARTLDLSFNRIQFTPDMVPSDITGTEVLMSGAKSGKEFRFIKGPIFSNIVLADEINRTPPKTQSALLQAMEERQVTILGETYELPNPFYVLATQNPIEYKGTYPLPEAQLDRFLLYIYIDYPSPEEEMEIIDANPENLSEIRPVIKHSEIKQLIEEAKKVPISDKLKKYAMEIVRNTRSSVTAYKFIKNYVEWGAGPRATQMLVRTAKTHAFLYSKPIADKEDIDAMLFPVLKHRIILNYNAVSENVGFSDLIEQLQKKVEAKV